MKKWLRHPWVFVAAAVLVTLVAIRLIPELVRLAGITGTLAQITMFGAQLVLVAGVLFGYWLLSAPIRRAISDARGRGNTAAVVEPTVWLDIAGRFERTEKVPPAIFTAAEDGVRIWHEGHTLFFADWSRLGPWSTEYGNVLSFSVDGVERRLHVLDERLLYPASRKSVAAIAAELDARRLRARAST
jgi:hypothetical protein